MDEVQVHGLCDFPSDGTVSWKMHGIKEHILCYGKTHQEKTGRKYTPQLTVVQLEVGFFWGGRDEFLSTFLYIQITNLRPQNQVCKRYNFILIYYKLISTLSPILLVMKTLQSIPRKPCPIKFCSIWLLLADSNTAHQKSCPFGPMQPCPSRSVKARYLLHFGFFLLPRWGGSVSWTTCIPVYGGPGLSSYKTLLFIPYFR